MNKKFVFRLKFINFKYSQFISIYNVIIKQYNWLKQVKLKHSIIIIFNWFLVSFLFSIVTSDFWKTRLFKYK